MFIVLYRIKSDQARSAMEKQMFCVIKGEDASTEADACAIAVERLNEMMRNGNQAIIQGACETDSVPLAIEHVFGPKKAEVKKEEVVLTLDSD